MSRIIKFRAWDEDEKKMISLFDCYDIFGRELRATKATLEQFTGLLDKNGKEIYEGDILKIGKSFWQVEWNDEKARWDCVDTTTYKPIGGMDFTGYIEVIGNIHENPDLLTP